MGVKDSEISKPVISIRKLSFSSVLPLMGKTAKVESDVFAPSDLCRGLFSSNVKLVNTRINRRLS